MNIHRAGAALGGGTPWGDAPGGLGAGGGGEGRWSRATRGAALVLRTAEPGGWVRLGPPAGIKRSSEPTNQNTSYKLPSRAVSSFLFLSFSFTLATWRSIDLWWGIWDLETAPPHSADSAGLPTSQDST